MRPDVVDYLRENMKKFSPEDLQRQLREEGISDADFTDCMVFLKNNSPVPPVPARGKLPPALKTLKTILFVGSTLLLLVGIALLLPSKPAPPPPASAAPSSTGESGYVGHAGWVVRLPRDYVGMTQFHGTGQTDEVVHFCPRGTEPANFLNEDLFGQLGIVRLEVAPSDFPSNPTGVAALAKRVSQKLREEKFSIKNIQIGTLPGVQVNVLSPFPRVETYVLGRNQLYFFYGGQEDDVWRDIVLSLRDAHSEN